MRVFSPADDKKKTQNNEVSNDNDIIFGEITPNTIPMLNALMEGVYNPQVEFLRSEKT